MDRPLDAASRALRVGDPLGALRQVALRDDPAALALRGIAMAQLGDFARARQLLRRAARGFGSDQVLARARCASAEAEVALAARELGTSTRALDDAIRCFDAAGDRANALHARLVLARRLLLLGEVDQAELAIVRLDLRGAPALLAATAALVAFDIAVRRACFRPARDALERARRAAARADVPALSAEVEQAARTLSAPSARLIVEGRARPISLEQLERLLASTQLIVDARTRQLRAGREQVSFARRPVLFALLRALAEAGPDGAARAALVWAGFDSKRVSPSLRARLRVEMGRLRALVKPFADLRATEQGFALSPSPARSVLVLTAPVDGADAAVHALLSDGSAWSSSALALALGASQRTTQRTLTELEASGHAQGFGRGRARRWVARPVSGFATGMLLYRVPPNG